MSLTKKEVEELLEIAYQKAFKLIDHNHNCKIEELRIRRANDKIILDHKAELIKETKAMRY